MTVSDEPARPREIIARAAAKGVGVMGIRAVQAGALTDGIDREVPDDDPTMVDFRRAAPFRELARELGESPASLAHRYALSMPGVDTVVLGVKDRAELRECLAAEAKGALPADIVKRIDEAASRDCGRALISLSDPGGVAVRSAFQSDPGSRRSPEIDPCPRCCDRRKGDDGRGRGRPRPSHREEEAASGGDRDGLVVQLGSPSASSKSGPAGSMPMTAACVTSAVAAASDA